jgi:hypothetical protein
MGTIVPNSIGRRLSSRALLVGIAGVVALVAIPTMAQAASRSGVAISGTRADAGTPTPRSSSICDKVSAATISSIIGYKVPAGTATTFNIKPTAANYHISGTNTVCTYGTASSMSALLKDVSLTYEVTSKPVTAAEMEQSIKKTEKLAKFTFTSYSGLGVPGYYFSLTEDGITGQGITGVQNGTHFFGSSVESKTVSKSALAALAKLAENL